MPQIRNFSEAQAALRPFYDNVSQTYTLDVITALMAYLGNPQDKLRVLHVEGTSGKTSTAYYCAALLKEGGKTVGLSVSPHIDTISERLQVNGTPVSETEFCAVLGEFLKLVAESGLAPSYFEVLVAMAYWEFARRGVDYAVMEVGLGGLLDGTNVANQANKVCLVTDIGFDHTHILGKTLAEIAYQKAGIIHRTNEVFMYQQSPEIMNVVQDVVTEKAAVLHVLKSSEAIDLEELPPFQRRNLELASQAVDYVLRRDYQEQLTLDTLHRAANVVIPGRLQRIMVGGKQVILDGAHNQQKLETMLDSIEQLYPSQPPAVLCAFVRGQEERWQAGLDVLIQKAAHIIFTSFTGAQDEYKTSVDPETLRKYCEDRGFTDCQVIVDTATAYTALLARPEPVRLVTGSLYLLSYVRPLIKERV
jgi:dihydrofolate synthase/folylpolyglutamate synthase